MRIIGNDPNTPRQTQVVASGTLSTGDTVVVNSDGTVSAVGLESISEQLGTATTFNAGQTSQCDAVYDTANDKVVMIFKDESDSNYGKVVIGTISGTSISFGTEVNFVSSSTVYMAIAYDANAGKVVIFYTLNDTYLYCKVGTVSGTSISFGSQVTINNSFPNYSVSADYDSVNQKVVYAIERSTSNGRCAVGTVSGTSISFGSEAIFNSGQTTLYPGSLRYNSTAQEFVVAYRDRGNSNYGTAIVGTVSGTSISFGTEVVFNSANSINICVTDDTDTGKSVVFYKDNSASGGYYAHAKVATVSSQAISFGSVAYWMDGETNRTAAVYNPAAQKHIVFAPDQAQSVAAYYNQGTVSGTSISFGTATQYESGVTIYATAAVYDPDQKVVAHGFADSSDGSYGKGIVLRSAYSSTNLTAENYIGTAKSGAADGDGVVVNTQGNVDTGQTGLTAGQSYYVQADGTLSTTAGDPSVFAGTAVSSTKLIVKG